MEEVSPRVPVSCFQKLPLVRPNSPRLLSMSVRRFDVDHSKELTRSDVDTVGAPPRLGVEEMDDTKRPF